MRGFMLDKKDEDYLRNKLSKDICKEVFNEDTFDNITIVNPVNSNRIYIINNIYVQSDNEEFYLRIGQSSKEGHPVEGSDNFLFIQENREEDEYIYVTRVKKEENREVELLQKGCVILLPQGYLNIKVEKPINRMKIKVYLKEENIH